MGPTPPNPGGSPRPVSRDLPRDGSGHSRPPRSGPTPDNTPVPGAGGERSSGPVSSGPVSSGPPVKGSLAPRILFKDLALTLGIPPDALSSRLLSLLRYFSLPPGGERILKLRREILAAQPAGTSPAEGTRKTPEAAALGAVAAADKGIVLSPEALAEYAAAIDPEGGQAGEGELKEKPGQDQGAGDQDSWDQEPQNQDAGDQGPRDQGSWNQGSLDQGPRDQGPKDRQKGEDSGETGRLRKAFEDLSLRQPLLDLLNRLPGKNGQRWMVFPFTFISGGVAFEVSLRILLNNTKMGPGETRFVLDISGKKGRWVFCLSGYGTGHSRADIGVFPPLPRRALKKLEGELRELLGDFTEVIHTENREKSFLAEEENRGTLASFDEEV